MSELVAAVAHDEFLILPRGKVRLHGIDFDENFLSELVARHFRRQQWLAKPLFSDAYGIYMRENPSAHRRKFKTVAQQAYALFVAQFGDMPLDELRHVHITEFRDSQLARGLHANSVRRHINMLNAMVNMAFKHLDIDRLSPFRRVYIRGEGELSRTMAPITQELLRNVKAHLLSHPIPSRLAALFLMMSTRAGFDQAPDSFCQPVVVWRAPKLMAVKARLSSLGCRSRGTGLDASKVKCRTVAMKSALSSKKFSVAWNTRRRSSPCPLASMYCLAQPIFQATTLERMSYSQQLPSTALRSSLLMFCTLTPS